MLFQEPVQYSETVRGNVELGNLASRPDDEGIRAALGLAGAAALIERLPAGAGILLGSWFPGGTELSVGEWQRLALARAVVRDAPVILLDEPTSAMDSWSEIEWLERLRQLTEGRTTLIISHRLTTAMRADVIHVLEEGHVVESGTHDELLELGGRYSAAWHAQSHPAG